MANSITIDNISDMFLDNGLAILKNERSNSEDINL